MRLDRLAFEPEFSSERELPNGTVFTFQRSPMPGGGFVTTYTDITDYQYAVAELEEAKRNLVIGNIQYRQYQPGHQRRR